jgi:uncharacterized protein
LSVYLDASLLVAIVNEEENTPKARRFVRSLSERPFVSDFARGEVASAISRLFRMGKIEIDEARNRLEDFDEWLAAVAEPIATEAADVRLAIQFVRQFATGLRMPDAIHLAAAQIRGLRVVTFDQGMSVAAEELRIPLEYA